MNEKDVVNLYRSLMRCRDGFMQGLDRRTERQPVGVAGMLLQPLTGRMDRGGRFS